MAAPHQPHRWVVAAAVAALVTAGGACSDDEPTAGSFCEELRQAPSLAAVLTGFADQDPSDLEERLDDAAEQYRDLRESAPEEISPDVDRTVDLVEAVIEAVRADSDDPQAAAATIRATVDDHPEAATSGRAVADYANRECGVDLDPAVDDDQVSEDPPATEGEDGEVEGGM